MNISPTLATSLKGGKKVETRFAAISAEWNISDASVGTEELAHFEIVGAIVHQLTKDLSPEELIASGFDKYYVDHTLGLWPQAAGGIPFNACEFQSKGDPVTDLFEDMAADGATVQEQPAAKYR